MSGQTGGGLFGRGGSGSQAGGGQTGAFVTGGGSVTTSGAAAAGGSAASQGPARTVRLVASRKWISRRGPGSRVTFVLRLRRRAVVEFTVFRVAPDCRLAGTFRVKAHAGVNRVGFRGRIGQRRLRPGTYLIRARTVPAHPTDTVLETKLVIFRSGNPSRSQVRAAQAAGACPRPTFEKIGLGFGSFLARNTTGPPPGPGAKTTAVRSEGEDDNDGAGAVLGARFDRTEDAVKAIHPLIWIGLGIAIALLALAAAPVEAVRGARVAALLAYRRTAVAFAGAAALVLVTVAYVLT